MSEKEVQRYVAWFMITLALIVIVLLIGGFITLAVWRPLIALILYGKEGLWPATTFIILATIILAIFGLVAIAILWKIYTRK